MARLRLRANAAQVRKHHDVRIVREALPRLMIRGAVARRGKCAGDFRRWSYVSTWYNMPAMRSIPALGVFLLCQTSFVNLGAINAATITKNANGDVVSIQNLMVGAAAYNVVFHQTANPTLEGIPGLRMFGGNQQGANQAATAIADLLNGQNPVPPLVFSSQIGQAPALRSARFHVFYHVIQINAVDTNFSYGSEFRNGSWGAPQVQGLQGGGPNSAATYARFTLVPEPGSIALACFGLAAILRYRRRLRRASVGKHR